LDIIHSFPLMRGTGVGLRSTKIIYEAIARKQLCGTSIE